MYCFKKVFISGVALAAVLGFSSVSAFASGSQTGVLNASNVNLRSGPGTSTKIVESMPDNLKVSILETTNNWYKITTPLGKTGWVLKGFVEVKKTSSTKSSSKKSSSSTSSKSKSTKSTKNTKSTKSSSSAKSSKLLSSSNSRGDSGDDRSSGMADKIISYAKQFLGVSYVYGGSSPDGFDCSGFTYYVFSHYGIKLDRVASGQANDGTHVSRDQLQPGDLVLFDTHKTQSTINHVGIYIGNGKFIQASSGGSEVMISDLTTGFYDECYMTARRVL